MNQNLATNDPARSRPVTDLDALRVGDWCWVTCKDEGEEKAETHLMCVSNIGSNHVEFRRSYECGEYIQRIHFKNFLASCKPEPNPVPILQERVEEAKRQLAEKTKELREKAQSLFLMADNNVKQPESLLPVPATESIDPYRKRLVQLKNDPPQIQKDIKTISENFAIATRDLVLSEKLKMEKAEEALERVSDQIFVVELYAGIHERVHRPAPADTMIAIRQLMLFMDEETLIDYGHGGMDFNDLAQFDEWVSRAENLKNILPEDRGGGVPFGFVGPTRITAQSAVCRKHSLLSIGIT